MFRHSKTGVNTVMTTATLRRVVRDPRSGEVHLPSERVAIMRVMSNSIALW
jgi:hypothetical protein